MSLVGIAIKGRATAGVMYQPFYNGGSNSKPGRMIYGMKGLGAFGYTLNQKIQSDGMIITTSRVHYDEVTKRSIDILSPSKVLQAGGAGYKCLQVLEG